MLLLKIMKKKFNKIQILLKMEWSSKIKSLLKMEQQKNSDKTKLFVSFFNY